MKSTNTARSLALGLWVLSGGALSSAACVDHVDTAIKSCPCAGGNVCCESGVCASDEAACGAATMALSASVQGEWEGYVENLTPGGDDPIRIAVSVAGDGTLAGTVTFGADQPPAPATDPALPWPAGFMPVQTTYVSGFPYTAQQISWQARRLKLRVVTYEPWRDWCALQQSYPAPVEIIASGYTCVPAGVTQDAQGNCSAPAPVPPGMPAPVPPDPPIAVNCQKASECYEMCVCDVSSCKAVADVSYPLDIAFDGANAEGSISFWNTNYNLRLTRAHQVR